MIRILLEFAGKKSSDKGDNKLLLDIQFRLFMVEPTNENSSETTTKNKIITKRSIVSTNVYHYDYSPTTLACQISKVNNE